MVWIGWRLLKPRGGVYGWGSLMHVDRGDGRTLCGRKLPQEGHVFEWFHGPEKGDQCERCRKAEEKRDE